MHLSDIKKRLISHLCKSIESFKSAKGKTIDDRKKRFDLLNELYCLPAKTDFDSVIKNVILIERLSKSLPLFEDEQAIYAAMNSSINDFRRQLGRATQRKEALALVEYIIDKPSYAKSPLKEFVRATLKHKVRPLFVDDVKSYAALSKEAESFFEQVVEDTGSVDTLPCNATPPPPLKRSPSSDNLARTHSAHGPEVFRPAKRQRPAAEPPAEPLYEERNPVTDAPPPSKSLVHDFVE